MTFTNKSLHTSRSNMSFIKGATLFFLGMTCVMVMTQALEVKSIATNAIQYISKVVLTASGTSASATGVYLDGVSGNGYFAGKVGIGTGASNIYTINTNGGLRVGDGESSSPYGAIYSDNGFYKTYMGKYTDENNAGSINYGILINGSGNFGSSMMGLRVIMQNVTRRAATFIGRVGIGTDAPAYDLDVVGTGRFSSGLIVGNNNEYKLAISNGYMQIERECESLEPIVGDCAQRPYGIQIHNDSGPGGANETLTIEGGNITSSYYLTLSSKYETRFVASGYTIQNTTFDGVAIGRGLFSPQATLHVKTPAGTTGTVALFEAGGSTAGQMEINGGTTNQMIIRTMKAGTDLKFGTFLTGTNSPTTGFNDYQLYLNNNGNVGIGIQNPQAKLEVNGGIQISNSYGDIDNGSGCATGLEGTMIYKRKTVLGVSIGVIYVCTYSDLSSPNYTWKYISYSE